MRPLLLLSFALSLVVAVVAGCGDDPGSTDLPLPYPPDAAYDGVDIDALGSGQP